MKALDSIQVINDLAAYQQGLFTAAQAQASGIERVTLTRLEGHGQIERISHGVYRAGGAPSIRAEEILAAWMALNPNVPTYQRDRGPNGFTASLNTAAWLLELGELNPTPITFSHPSRRQTRKKGLIFLKRKLEETDIVIVSGIPTTSAARTVLDLIDYKEDFSLVASVLSDALDKALIVNEASLKEEIDNRAKPQGFAKDFPLYDYLRSQ